MPDTKGSQAEWARELRTLEDRFQAGTMSPTETERWNELAVLIFGEEGFKNGRRSFRLPTQVAARVRIRQGEFACNLLDISRLGLTLAGGVFRHVSQEETVEILGIDIGAAQGGVGLQCQIVRVDLTKDAATAGLRFAKETTPEQRRRFFDEVYYPLYLRFLEGLSG